MEDDGNKGSTDTSRASTSFISAARDRQRFTVDLRPGETTIVSWKKLVKDAKFRGNSAAAEAPPAIAHPSLESCVAPGQPSTEELKDEPPTNRFSAVIEKIERLYMGKQSSDEEDLADVPDDDQYDTDDSFIDDAELDKYFEVDKSTTKHSGFFINRGKLEQMSEPTLLPNQQARKRRRKEVKNTSGESNDASIKKHVKLASKVGEESGGPSSAAGEHSALKSTQTKSDKILSASPSRSVLLPGEKYADSKPNNQLSTFLVTPKKRADLAVAYPSSTARLWDSTMPSSVLGKKNDVQVPTNLDSKQKDASRLHEFLSQNNNEGSKGMHLKSIVRQGGKDAEIEFAWEGRNGLHEIKSQHILRKDGPGLRTKATSLEKAVRELEETVADARSSMVVNDADLAQAVKKRLPREIKQKLTKVAKVVQASHGKISEELINCLIPLLGHWIQPRSLKRHLKIMMSLSLSAKKEKDDRFQHIKREMTEMIRTQFPPARLKETEQIGGTMANSLELVYDDRGLKKKTVSMSTAMEDKICDLYDLYVDGFEENATPQIKKLYMELAEMWPNGLVDIHGIKRAICRAKERKKSHNNQKMGSERVVKKKLTPRMEEAARREGDTATQQMQQSREKYVGDRRPMDVATRLPSTSSYHLAEKMKRRSYTTEDGTRVPVKTKKVKRKSGGYPSLQPPQVRNPAADSVKRTTEACSTNALVLHASQSSQPLG